MLRQQLLLFMAARNASWGLLSTASRCLVLMLDDAKPTAYISDVITIVSPVPHGVDAPYLSLFHLLMVMLLEPDPEFPALDPATSKVLFKNATIGLTPGPEETGEKRRSPSSPATPSKRQRGSSRAKQDGSKGGRTHAVPVFRLASATKRTVSILGSSVESRPCPRPCSMASIPSPSRSPLSLPHLSTTL